MKIREIWVSKEDFDDPDPEGLVLGVGGFAVWAMDECGLGPDDFPAVALQSYWADQYLGEVMNGGHKQFAHNTRLSVEAMTNTERGLEAFGEVEALATFRSFKAIVANPAIARNLIETTIKRSPSPSANSMHNALTSLLFARDMPLG